MNIKLSAIGLALFAGVGALALPAVGHAGNVGYTAPCLGGNVTSAITNAGHTPVAVGSANAASLASLDALIVESCFGYAHNADIDAAVADGMLLIVNDWVPNGTTAGKLPGSPAITFTYTLGTSIELASGSPIATGIGGTLTNSSLDSPYTFIPYIPSRDGYTASGLSADMTSLLTTSNSTRSVALAYPYGNGFVAYSAIPMDTFLPNGLLDAAHLCTPGNLCGGMQTYLTNLLDWSIKQLVSCEKEGYKGAQLTWCKNICENGLTGQVLDTWIHRWINRYRDLPYCAVEGQPGEQGPAPE